MLCYSNLSYIYICTYYRLLYNAYNVYYIDLLHIYITTYLSLYIIFDIDIIDIQ